MKIPFIDEAVLNKAYDSIDESLIDKEDLARNKFKRSYFFETSEIKQHINSKLPNIFEDFESFH